MRVTEADIPGIKIIAPDVYPDSRGVFMESFNAKRYRDCGLPATFVQDNFSRSKRGVLRGLHFQASPDHAQGKLVWVARGAVFDVAVDLRVGAPTFGRAFSLELNERNRLQMYIPPGFAHGFYVLSDEADFHYKCTRHHHAEAEMGIAWDDPALGIDWPGQHPILSDKDRAHPNLADIDRALLPIYKQEIQPEPAP